jgi:hypothetical protein
MLKHRTLADEIDILFRKRAAPQFFDERAKPIPLPCSQYDSATIWNARFRRGFEKHLGKPLSNYQARKAKTDLYFDPRTGAQEFRFYVDAAQSREGPSDY